MRPSFHFTARTGWINDPHGVTFRDGGYHAFFQHVPNSLEWASNCHWGHATGPDLLSLTEGPVALAPGEGDDGVWTGTLVRDEKRGDRILYTAVTEPDLGIGRVRVAVPTDATWNSWVKGDVVADAPPGLDFVAYRDPFVLAEPDGSWRMFLGAAFADGEAAALSYRSTDLDTWHYEKIALQRSTREREPVWMGALWECPQIIAVGDRHVMISSVWDADVLHYAGYAIGDYADGTFTAERWGRLTYGPSHYAPSFFRDAAGRACLIFWMRGVQDTEAGWAGAHSVPYLLELRDDRLVAVPHPDLETYRGRASVDGRVDATAAEVIWTPGSTLTINGEDGGAVVLGVADGTLTLRAGEESWQMPYGGGEVRVIVDGPVLELACVDGVMGTGIEPLGASLHLSSDSSFEARTLER